MNFDETFCSCANEVSIHQTFELSAERSKTTREETDFIAAAATTKILIKTAEQANYVFKFD